MRRSHVLGCKALGVVEVSIVVSDFDHDQRSGDLTYAGYRLQKNPGIGLHGVTQSGVELFQKPFQLPLVFPDFRQHQAIPSRQVGIEIGQLRFPQRFKAAAEFDQIANCQTDNQANHHSASDQAVDLGIHVSIQLAPMPVQTQVALEATEFDEELTKFVGLDLEGGGGEVFHATRV